VSSTVQVPNLNASLLGGNAASSFVQGSGKVSSATSTLNNQSTGFLVGTSDQAFYLQASCDPTGLGSGAAINLYNASAQAATGYVLSNNVDFPFVVASGGNELVLTGFADMLTMQVVSGARVMTFTATEHWTATNTADVCVFTGQVLSNT
jgi:hypothetical protein